MDGGCMNKVLADPTQKENILTQFCDLDYEMERMNKNVEILYEKLNAVLLPPYLQECCDKSECGQEERSHITHLIREKREFLRSMNYRLKELIDRIDL